MTAVVSALVTLGLLLVVALGVVGGFDLVRVVILVFIATFGALAVAVVMRLDTVTPGRCDRCRGLLSPSAPYCKHCGAPV